VTAPQGGGDADGKDADRRVGGPRYSLLVDFLSRESSVWQE